MQFYVSIGNSDDKLSQKNWADFYREVDEEIRSYVSTIHGAWVSPSTSHYQNACWCFEFREFHPELGVKLRNHLRDIASRYSQDSITWAEVEKIEFLSWMNPQRDEKRHQPLAENCKKRGSGWMHGVICSTCKLEELKKQENENIDRKVREEFYPGSTGNPTEQS